MKQLEPLIEEYLRLRRALGFKLKDAEHLLGQFAEHFAASGATTITVDAVVAWAVKPDASADWHSQRLAAIRPFLKWLQVFEPETEVPPPHVLPPQQHRLIPYLYTDAQIHDLLERTGALQPPLRAATYTTLIGLLSCTGLRVGEAIRADSSDLSGDVLTVADTKFGKTRLVPLHPSTVEALAAYRHTVAHELRRPLRTSALFVSTAGTRLHYKNVHCLFHRLIGESGITAQSSRCRPRIHDLRHTFAMQTMTDAYRNGSDPARVLAVLATYLGHADPRSTYWYLQGSPQLLTQAAARLNQPETTQSEEVTS